MKKLLVITLLLFTGLTLHACSTTCGPPKNAQGSPTVIQYPEK